MRFCPQIQVTSTQRLRSLDQLWCGQLGKEVCGLRGMCVGLGRAEAMWSPRCTNPVCGPKVGPVSSTQKPRMMNSTVCGREQRMLSKDSDPA